ncbi:hypothetical protein AVEN_68604-1 [Araneus ventricosus]|uniref:Uncharacterized protein n=1 Tax=Araneus ventricosus TaxID=182803 RepID=A0A4Y2JQC7_ARAVE|nr:hypothetical protein AVEN_68604-1 [Araneus ventricosus]
MSRHQVPGHGDVVVGDIYFTTDCQSCPFECLIAHQGPLVCRLWIRRGTVLIESSLKSIYCSFLESVVVPRDKEGIPAYFGHKTGLQINKKLTQDLGKVCVLGKVNETRAVL